MASETMFDITVASMKLGVAVPIQNASFKFWDDPGTWTEPSRWYDGGSYFSPVRLKEAGTFRHIGYDDDAALSIGVSSAPDDFTRVLYSGNGEGVRMWPSTQWLMDTGQDFYYSMAVGRTVGTGGANKKIAILLEFAATASMASKTQNVLVYWTTTDSDLQLITGSATSVSLPLASYFARVGLAFRDITSGTVLNIDCLGVMFDPITGNAYKELTNVFPVAGPPARRDRFSSLVKSPSQVAHQYDPSGGAEVIRLGLDFRQEDQDFYKTMLDFYNLNKGVPGVPGVPLALEPNIPGLPPMLVGNFINPTFPMVLDSDRGELYSGTFEFETLW